MNKKIKQEDIENIIELHKKGLNKKEISRKTKLPYHLVRYHLNPELSKERSKKYWNNLPKERRTQYNKRRAKQRAEYKKRRYNNDKEYREKIKERNRRYKK